MNKKFQLVWLASVAVIFFILPSVQAYTGNFAFSPPLTGGPDTKETTVFDVDTETSNPQTIITDLNFVYKIIIETTSGQTGPLHVKEYPDGDDPAWDIIVTKPINDDLVKATIYFWAANSTNTTMTVIHQHTGEPDIILTAYKVSPATTDSTGRILWYFETTSFSTFFVNKKPERELSIPYAYIGLLMIFSLSACILLRKK
jgi:hypothetical protein